MRVEAPSETTSQETYPKRSDARLRVETECPSARLSLKDDPRFHAKRGFFMLQHLREGIDTASRNVVSPSSAPAAARWHARAF